MKTVRLDCRKGVNKLMDHLIGTDLMVRIPKLYFLAPFKFKGSLEVKGDPEGY